MSNPPRLGFGIIGVGMIANYHCLAIREAKGAHLVGVAARTAESVKVFAEKNAVNFSTTAFDNEETERSTSLSES